MAQPIYSRTFISGTLNTPTPQRTFVVPAGFVAVIRTSTAVQDVSTSATFLYFSAAQSGVAFIPYFTPDFPTTTPLNKRAYAVWSGRIAVVAGGTISVQRLGTSVGHAIVSGYLLTV